jgi:hypothetical protein
MAESNEGSRCLQTGRPSCLVCQTIADAVTNGVKGVVLLGDWEGFLGRVDCETCQQIVLFFKSMLASLKSG